MYPKKSKILFLKVKKSRKLDKKIANGGRFWWSYLRFILFSSSFTLSCNSQICCFKLLRSSNNVSIFLTIFLKLISGKNIFPGNIFPPIIQKLISELESTLNFSPDYTSASILYAVSISIGNRIQLKVKNSWLIIQLS